MAVSRKIANFAAQYKFLSKRLLDSQNIRFSLSLLHLPSIILMMSLLALSTDEVSSDCR